MNELRPELARSTERLLTTHHDFVARNLDIRRRQSNALDVGEFFGPFGETGTAVAEGAGALAAWIADIRTETMLEDSGVAINFSSTSARERLLAWLLHRRMARSTLAGFNIWLGRYPGVAGCLDADDIDDFLGQHVEGRAPEEVLAGLDGRLALLYWQSLTIREQVSLARTAPDLVVEDVLNQGGTVSDDIYKALKTGLEYPVAEREVWSSIGIEVPVTTNFFIDFGGDTTGLVTLLSNGQVEVTIIKGLSLAGGADLDSGDVEASLAAGVFTEDRATYRFGSQSAAAAMVDDLITAVDNGVGDFVIAAGKVAIVQTINPFAGFKQLWSEFNTWRNPTHDFSKYDANLVAESDEIGARVTGEANAEFDIADFEAEFEGAAQIEVSYHRYDDALLDDNDYVGFDVVGQLEVTGTIEGELAELGVGGTAMVNAEISVRQYGNGDTMVVIVVEHEAGQAGNLEILDYGVADSDQRFAATTRATTEIAVPVTDETVGAVTDAVTKLAQAQLPIDELNQLHDIAEITTTAADVTSTTNTTSVDAEVAVEVSHGSSTSETTAISRKPSGRDAYDVIGYNEIVDALARAS